MTSMRDAMRADPQGASCSRCGRYSDCPADVVASMCWQCTAGYADKLGKLDSHLAEKGRKRRSKAH